MNLSLHAVVFSRLQWFVIKDWRTTGIMKTKEPSRLIREEDVERFKAGLHSKTIIS